MATIGNNADTLLHGLSAFWHRFFRDIGDIQATYEGTEILLGQVYLNFLSDVLNTSVVEAPLFRKEFYKLITIREDQLVYHEKGDDLSDPPGLQFYGNRGDDRYVFASDTIFGAIPHLQDTLFAPGTSLEEGVDYLIAGGEIQLSNDPTNPPTPGFASRRVVVGTGGKFKSATTNWLASGVEKGDILYFSEATDLGIGTPLNAQDAARKATIIHVTSTHLTVSSDTPLPVFPAGAEPSGFSWRVMRLRDDGAYNPTLPRAVSANAPFTDGQIERVTVSGRLENITTLEVNEVSFWAVDAQVDDLTLYNTYGYFFTNPKLSTETYRSLVRGLMQLYILGPALARLESALNLTASLPTIREEGEVLAAYDNGVLGSGIGGQMLVNDVFQIPVPLFSTEAVGGFIKISASDFYNNIGTFNIIKYLSPTQVVLKPVVPFTPDVDLAWVYTMNNQQSVATDRNLYTYPLETPMRADVKDPSNNGSLTFRAFETLTTAIQVTDYVQDPEWWHSITIPQELLPETPAPRRVVTSQLYPNIIGPVGDANIGDPGFYIGVNEEGETATVPYRHNAAFILMDRFLKMHMFGVLVDSSVSLTNLLVTDLQKILKDVKPVHTALYFRPVTAFTDVINLVDEAFLIGMKRQQFEELKLLANDLVIGSSWNIGDTWKFAGANGGSISINPGSGGVYVAIGGADPTIQPADPTDIPSGTLPDLGWLDRALYVYTHL